MKKLSEPLGRILCKGTRALEKEDLSVLQNLKEASASSIRTRLWAGAQDEGPQTYHADPGGPH